jgi:hypothetical protein
MRMLAQRYINSVSPGLPLLNWSELNIKQGLSLSANTAKGWGLGEVEMLPNLCQLQRNHLAKRCAYDRKRNLCHQI